MNSIYSSNSQEKLEKEEEKLFRRNKDLKDQWDYISTINSFMGSYTHLMHL